MCDIGLAPQQCLPKSVIADSEIENEIRRADNAIARRNSHRTLPRLHFVDDQIARAGNFVIGQVFRDDIVIFIFIRERADEHVSATGDDEHRHEGGEDGEADPDRHALGDRQAESVPDAANGFDVVAVEGLVDLLSEV